MLGAVAPGGGLAVERERTAPVSSLPLSVEPSPPFLRAWLEAQPVLDGAGAEATLSDGGRWRRDRLRPRWELSAGGSLGPISAAVQGGLGTAALAVQVDPLRGEGWMLGVGAAARLVYGGGWDLSLSPVVAARRWTLARAAIVPFGAVRARLARTLYEVQGWSADRSSPYAEVATRDLGLAPMAGIAAVTRFVELRLTLGWEVLLLDRVVHEDRPAAFSRTGGPFAALALRLRLGLVP